MPHIRFTPNLHPMRLLDRYLLKELLTALACCLGGFLIFWIAFDLFSDIDEFQKARLSSTQIAFYYVLRLPDLLNVVLPISLLLATLYSLTRHARNHELTAIRAAGVGVWRMFAPHLMVGFLASVLLFVLNEVELMEGAMASKQQFSERLRSGQSGALKNVYFVNGRDQRTWHIGSFNPATGELQDVDVKWKNPNGSSRHVTARSATWSQGAWLFKQVQEFVYEKGPDALAEPRSAPELRVPELHESPGEILAVMRVSGLTGDRAARTAQLTLREIANYKRFYPELRPRERALVDTQWHARLASPWTCLIVVLVAIPFGAASGRRNVFVGVASSVMIVFAFFILMRFGLALGTGGMMPAAAAAWLPNLTFGLLGAIFTHKLR